ncbi:MAG: carbon-nitrogen hydrolase family protein [Candidatus Helarchaeota archaeon]
MKVINVAAIQCRMRPEGTLEKILKRAEELIEQAVKQEAQVVCLPERWNFKKGNIEGIIESYNGITMKFLQETAKEMGVYLIGGAIWVKNAETKENHIISAVYNPQGELLAIQRKLHLYLIEKSLFIPGNRLEIIDTEFGKVGVAICFDMTFPEVARYYAINGVDIIFSPVLIRQEGIENWHIYLKARALENRMPVCAVNCVGEFNNRIFTGQSLLIDFKKGYETPSKLQIQKAPKNEECILFKTIDLHTARKLRKKRLAERLLIDNKWFQNSKT